MKKNSKVMSEKDKNLLNYLQLLLQLIYNSNEIGLMDKRLAADLFSKVRQSFFTGRVI